MNKVASSPREFCISKSIWWSSLNAWGPLMSSKTGTVFLWRRRQQSLLLPERKLCVHFVRSLTSRDWYKWLLSVMRWIWQSRSIYTYPVRLKVFLSHVYSYCSPIIATKLCLLFSSYDYNFFQVLPTSIQTLQLEGSDIRIFLLNLQTPT